MSLTSNLNLTDESLKETCLAGAAVHREMNKNDTSLGNLCGVIWDGFNCWGPALPGSAVYIACPAAKGVDVAKQAYRYCDVSGRWLNKDGFPDDKGWTNYTPCFTPEIFALIQRLYSGSETEAMTKIDIARGTRIVEFLGLSFSFLALMLSLFIFYYFRSLRNSRTRLHRHLFIAMVIQVTVRLTLYMDQFIVRSNLDEKIQSEEQDARGIDNTPILCEAAYICLEYARTSMFMWMFVEGLYLHNMITVTVFEEKLSPSIYPLVGWIFPIPLTMTWAIVTGIHYGASTCWWGYNFTPYFWILEGPRLAVLVVNLAFLLNILRVLVTKLRQSNSSEAHQARKAVKAALVLLPLLGLTNLLNMLDAPLERSAMIFGIWSYTTHILTSCQGLILAFLYCFWNGEVQIAIKKFLRYKLFYGCKNKTNLNRKGSVQLSPMNNKSPVEPMASNIPAPPRVELLAVNRNGNAPQSQILRLNPLKTNNNIDSIYNDEPSNNLHTLNELHHTENKFIEDNNAQDTLSLSSVKNNYSYFNSKNKQISMDFDKDKELHNIRRVSKLRIWISPLVIVNERLRRKLEESKNIQFNSEEEEDFGEINSAMGVESPGDCSTEGCHFQIEYYSSDNKSLSVGSESNNC